VATFYAAFRLRPLGRHHIQVCHGTACHVRGAVHLTGKLHRVLGVDTGEVTPDGLFSLEEVRCLGCCGLAPVVKIDDVVHGRLNQVRLERLLRPAEDRDEGAEQG
jgi:NADH-quinone oxidoreductase subunit E